MSYPTFKGVFLSEDTDAFVITPKQFSVTKIQIFSFSEEKCSSVWSYDKNISTFRKNVPLNTSKQI